MMVRYGRSGESGFLIDDWDYDAYCRCSKGRGLKIVQKWWRKLMRRMKVAERCHARKAA